MKRVKKFFWRFFPLVVCCCIIFSFSNYASAASSYTLIDYRDYAYDINTYEGVSTYVCAFPVKDTFMQWSGWIKGGNGALKSLAYTDGNTMYLRYYNFFDKLDHTFVLKDSFENTDSALVIRPLGYNVLDLTYVPNGTELVGRVSVKGDFEWADSSYFGIVYTFVAYQFFDKDGIAIKNTTVTEVYADITSEANEFVYQWSAKIDIPQGAVSMMPRVGFHIYTSGLADPNDWIYIDASKLQMQVSVDDLWLLQQQTGKTNERLEEIVDQNKDLINGTPEQNQQVGSAVDGLENSAGKMEDLADDMKVDKPDLSGVDVSPDSIVSVADRALLTAPLTKLWEDPTILGMITTVFILVLVSWVFFGKKG